MHIRLVALREKGSQECLFSLTVSAIFCAGLFLLSFSGCASNGKLKLDSPVIKRNEPIIIDHNCTDLSQIPETWINAAKKMFRISYGHTSHGSQIVTGMQILMARSDLYAFNRHGAGGALSFHDREPGGDLGNIDRPGWAQLTRVLLNSGGNDRNLIVWSWCGQVSFASAAYIDNYLSLMNQLEAEFPDVTFIYMTGHLDGTGESGNLNSRNEQIRDFCRTYNKILFDFADIERYDPDGNDYLDRGADDGCRYGRFWEGEKNWAIEWCTAHPGKCSSCYCAHSQCLNCELKGRAFWWMLARIAGWTPGS
jgi:hypothetical protein